MWPWSSYPVQPLEKLATSSPESGNTDGAPYDYIIIGGGTAGCVLANRLSEDPNVSVLLVERGPVVKSWSSRIPLLSADYRRESAPAYKWTTAPIQSFDQRTLNMVSGKGMGGTSKINAFLYTRSTPGEYNAWAQSGREGWSYDDLEPYFRRSEKSLSHGSSPHRGAEGLWENQALSEIYFENIFHVIKATTALGIPYIPEANSPDEPVTACTQMDRTIDSKSRRQSTFDAFLPLNIVTQRIERLKICTEVIATSIEIKKDHSGLRATGLFLEHDSLSTGIPKKRFYVRVRREIILCGGAIASPQLLMLSGIGPGDHLRQLGIPVVKDLAGVGMHLQDHYGVSVIYRAPRSDTLHAVETNPLLAFKEFLKYIFFGKGLFLSPNPQISIFTRSALLDENMRTVVQHPAQVDPRDSNNIPDIEIMPIPYSASDWEFDLKGDGAFSLLCVLLRPKSLGSVRLVSKDARVRPNCDLGSLAAEEDYTVLRKAVRLALKVGRQMKEQGYPLRDLHVPQNEGDIALDEFIRHGGRTTYHYSSTCRMAPATDVTPGVVDDELRVHGVQGLRVADASVFPSILATHLQAPTVMVAEKCADFLKMAWR